MDFLKILPDGLIWLGSGVIVSIFATIVYWRRRDHEVEALEDQIAKLSAITQKKVEQSLANPAELARAKAEVEDLRAKCSSLESVALANGAEEFKHQIHEAREELELSRSALMRAEEEVSHLREKLETMDTNQTQGMNGFDMGRFEEMEQTAKSTAAEVALLREHMERASAERERLLQQSGMLERIAEQIASLRLTGGGTTGPVSIAELESAKAELAVLEQRKTEFEAQVGELGNAMAEMSAMQARLNQAEALLAQQTEALAELHDTKHTLGLVSSERDRLASETLELREIKGEYEALQSQVVELQATANLADSLKAQVEEAKNSMESATAQAEGHKNELLAAESKVSALEQQRDRLASELDRLAQIEAGNNMMKQEVESLKAQLLSMESRSKMVDELEASVQNKEHELSSVRGLVGGLESDKLRLTRELEAAVGGLTEMTTLRAENEKLRVEAQRASDQDSELERLRSEARNASMQAEHSRQELESARIEIETLRQFERERDTVNAQLDAAKAEADDWKRQVLNQSSDVERMHNELSRLAETLLRRDQLDRISGLSANYAQRLYDNGIRTFAQLAALSPDRLRELVGTPNGVPVEPESWIDQAKEMARAGG